MTLDSPRFAAARLWAATRAPYLASALFACVPVDARDSGTVTVDRMWRVHADPDVVQRLDAAQLGKVLLHLTGHLVRDHAGRADNLHVDQSRAPWWNRCADAEINDDLAAADLLPPLKTTVPADLPARAGLLAEAYYAMVPVPPAEPTDPSRGAHGTGSDVDSSCGSGADGIDRGTESADGTPTLGPEQAERLRHAVAAEMQRTAQREPGSVPAGWLRWADALLESDVDWRRVLAAEVRRAVAAVSGSVDYTYRRLSRRSHTPSGAQSRVLLPSLFRPVPEVAIVCDTSGSMDDEALARVLAEVEAILTRAGLRSAGVQALAVDTEVHSARRVRRAADVALAGGGGTDMGAGIAAAVNRRPRPEVVIVLTDGMTPWPSTAPGRTRVVVGVIADDDHAPPTPDWARRVVIAL